MKTRANVMQALADARPARLDPADTPPLPFGLSEMAVTERRTRRFRVATLVPAGALAAVVVGGVAVVALDSGRSAPTPPVAGSSGNPSSGSSGEAVRPLTTSQILLTAAERSSEDVPRSGRYLVFRTENGTVYTVRSGAAIYQMTTTTSSEAWLSRSGKDSNWMAWQTLGMTPSTSADAAAWRAAGSPDKVTVGKPLPSGKVEFGTPASIAAGPREISTSKDSDVFAFGSTNVSVRDLEKLPTDPTALRTALLKHFDGGGSDMPTDRTQWLLTVASSLIADIPVSGPVRAAAFRLIATIPGTRSLGVVTDQRGRQGQAFAFTSTNAITGSIEHRFVIDTSTGRALAEETRVVRPGGTTAQLKPGSLVGYSVVLEQKTTDENPPK